MNENEQIYTNLLELLKYRKYNILSKTLNKNVSNEDYILIDTDKATVLYIVNYDTGIIKKGDIFIKKILDILKTNDKKIILITKQKLSSNLYKKIFTIKQSFYIEVILYNALIFNFPINNVNKHTEYIKLSENEKIKILNFLDVDPHNLLYICYDDKACIWFDLNENDIIQINTISPLSNIININYRLVINENLSHFRWILTNTKIGKYTNIINDDDINDDDASNKTGDNDNTDAENDDDIDSDISNIEDNNDDNNDDNNGDNNDDNNDDDNDDD